MKVINVFLILFNADWLTVVHKNMNHMKNVFLNMFMYHMLALEFSLACQEY